MHKKGKKNTSCVKKHKNRTFLFENRTKRKKAFLSFFTGKFWQYMFYYGG